jgi:MOSC domain-containing protein YiiM
MTGTVVAIHIAPKAAVAMVALQEARAVAGKGIEGDRYFSFAGTFSSKPGPDREITLIEIEQLEWLKREHGVELTAAASRRNVAVQGVRLNELVGREFSIGGVTVKGLRLCEPCGHLEKLSGVGNLKTLFKGRCGMRAQILTDGVIRIGDTVSFASVAP